MRVLAVCSHPDDETLGCGATLRKHVEARDEVSVLILSRGRSGKEYEQASDAAAVLGIGKIEALYFPDQQFDTQSLSVTRAIEEHIKACRPDVVYTHSQTDLNEDHRICARAVMTACRPQGDYSVKRILSFEIPSSTEWSPETFRPTVFSVVDKGHMAAKLDALCQYAGEIRPAPHPRSIEGVKALAKWRGATVGAEYAEAFALVRSVE